MSVEDPDDFTENNNAPLSPATVAPFLGVQGFANEAEAFEAVVLTMEQINERVDAALVELPRRDLNQQAQAQERRRLLDEAQLKVLATFHGWKARGDVLVEQELYFAPEAVRLRLLLSWPTNRVLAARAIAEGLTPAGLVDAVQHAVGRGDVPFGQMLAAEIRRRELPREIKERLLRQLDRIPLPEAEAGREAIQHVRGLQARADLALQGGVRAPTGAKLVAARRRGL
jgi:hypothetical protein